MKLIQRSTLSILLITILLFSACSKKDRNPKLFVHIQDENQDAVEGAKVHAWPTDHLTNTGDIAVEMDQTAYTDANGNITFEFPASAVLDIDVTYLLVLPNTTSVELTGHRVVKIETIKQKDEENVFEETVTIK